MLREFREFIARGNVIDLAVAVVIGAAFGRIVTSLVDGVIMPPIGLLTGGVDFANQFYVLGSTDYGRISLEQARASGIPVIAYGVLINDIVTFLIIAFTVFLILRHYNRFMSHAPADAPVTTKDCPLCLSTIPLAARRCSQCTAELGS